MLRSCPNKLGGVITMALSLFVLFGIGFSTRSGLPVGHYGYTIIFFLFVANFLLLGFLGASSADIPFTYISKLATVLYFVLLLLLTNFKGAVYNC